jgi:hypothetical protein
MKKYQKVQRLASSGTANFANCHGDEQTQSYCGSKLNYKAF